MKSFLTGSRAYGTPRPESDYDLVVLIDKDLEATLRASFSVPEDESLKLKGANGQELNLICVNDEDEYKAWFHATEFLKEVAPVSREHAIRYIKKMKEKYAAAVGREGISG